MTSKIAIISQSINFVHIVLDQIPEIDYLKVDVFGSLNDFYIRKHLHNYFLLIDKELSDVYKRNSFNVNIQKSLDSAVILSKRKIKIQNEMYDLKEHFRPLENCN